MTLRALNDTFLCGAPFYCVACGVGLGEWLECDSDNCELETRDAAQERLRSAHLLLKLTPQRGAINGDAT